MKDLDTIKFIERERLTPYQWGINDCNTLVLQYMDEVFNTKLLHKVYGKYRTKVGAIRFQKKFPFTLSEYLINAGCKKINPHKAVMGDLLIIDKGVYELGFICLGSKVASVPEDLTTDIAKIPSFNEFDWGLRYG